MSNISNLLLNLPPELLNEALKKRRTAEERIRIDDARVDRTTNKRQDRRRDRIEDRDYRKRTRRQRRADKKFDKQLHESIEQKMQSGYVDRMAEQLLRERVAKQMNGDLFDMNDLIDFVEEHVSEEVKDWVLDMLELFEGMQEG